jgi:hypothetical protein
MAKRVWQHKWFWGALAALLILTAAQLVLSFFGLDRQVTTSNGGIHMRAFGIFSASNNLHVEVNPAPMPGQEQEAEKAAAKD